MPLSTVAPARPSPCPPLIVAGVLVLMLLCGCARGPAAGADHDAPAMTVWQPEGELRGVIIALHSFGDYRAAFDHLGPWFAERGFAVYAADQRGFGSHPEAGHWPGDESLLRDLRDSIRQRSADYDAPLYLLGESMGGGVAMRVLASDSDLPVAGAILAAPSVRAGLRTRYLWNGALAVGATLTPGYTFTLTRDPQDPRYTPHSAARLAEDPQVLRQVRMDTYRDLIRFTDRASNSAADIAYPSLLLYGGNDDLIPRVSIERLRHQLAPRLTYRFYPEAPHLLLQGAHWGHYAADILMWLEDQQRAGQQGAHAQQ
ncbi:alpha/beta fold hydrolase [Isoalcanivorax indicus]|uniref:alpha/beta fold hydrolase n=1 Tax=Isoalcanivorax indicus TaxID=2202653 RepID=UPI0013C4FF30|nr:alpha/beta fold hydrolase [Isoalcanivorax indicus]